MKKIIIVLLVLSAIGLGVYFITSYQANKLLNDPNFTCGNGRIEATEINIAAKLAGKIENILVKEGDKVAKDQVLVKMQTNVLEAQLAQAKAQKEVAVTAEASAVANIAVKEAIWEAKKAEMERDKIDSENAQRSFERQKNLFEKQVVSQQKYDDSQTEWLTKKAAYLSSQAAVKEAEAQLNAAKADAKGAKAKILAAEANIAAIQADIDDSTLKSPLDGRIQYRIAEPGEVLSAGGRALNMIDLTDVYITFFVPEQTAGLIQLGADVRIVLDAAPEYPIPAKITYVSSVAQFTPKTVETKIERQKLMFRVKAHLDPEKLKKYIDLVKTGLPGVAWVRLEDKVEWPEELKTYTEKGGTLE